MSKVIATYIKTIDTYCKTKVNYSDKIVNFWHKTNSKTIRFSANTTWSGTSSQ